MTIPAGRYPINDDFTDVTLAGDTTATGPIFITSIPGPFESNAAAATGGVALNQLYRDNNKHIHIRIA